VDVRKYDDACNGMRVLRPDEWTQMAGRAGRRGMDKVGLVLYVPAWPPLQVHEMKKLMSARMTPLASRLLLSYEFFLRVLHTGRVSFDLLLERSYWARQTAAAAAAAASALEGVKRKRDALPLPAAARAACQEFHELQAQFAAAVNAARKPLQRSLEQWKNSHQGPKWKAAIDAFKEDGLLAVEQADVEGQLAALTMVPNERLAPVVRVLQLLGCLREGGGGGGGGGEMSLHTLSTSNLTLKGQLATGIAEGHCLLMAALYASGVLRGATGEEVVATLGATLNDKDSEDFGGKAEELDGVTPNIVAGVRTLQAAAGEGLAAEREAGLMGDEKYWQTGLLWVEIGLRWMRGATVPELTADYGMFEGNLYRGLLKLSNLLAEWQKMAAFCEHAEVLEALRGAPALLMRDIAAADSLYVGS